MTYLLIYLGLNLLAGFLIGRYVAKTDSERTVAALAGVFGLAIPILLCELIYKLMHVGKK
jgi:hypothetical protein